MMAWFSDNFQSNGVSTSFTECKHINSWRPLSTLIHCLSYWQVFANGEVRVDQSTHQTCSQIRLDIGEWSVLRRWLRIRNRLPRPANNRDRQVCKERQASLELTTRKTWGTSACCGRMWHYLTRGSAAREDDVIELKGDLTSLHSEVL